MFVINCLRAGAHSCIVAGVTVPLASGLAPRFAARAVLVISVALAVVEVGRIGVFGWTHQLAVAVAVTALYLPIHLWHLSYGLRGERPPRSGSTLAVMAAVHLVALLLIGNLWSYALASLAVSALVVLRSPWSFGVLGVCLLGPQLSTLGHAEPLPFGVTDFSLSYAVLLRALLQFAMVWLVAAVHQLAASRTALAAETTTRERLRLEAEVRASLELGLSGLVEASGLARAAMAVPGVSAALEGIDRVIALARGALSDLRAIVNEARNPRRHAAAAELAATARNRRTPIGQALGARGTWLRWAAAHATLLGFVLLMEVGVLLPGVPVNSGGVAAWVPLAVLVTAVSVVAARNLRPRWLWPSYVGIVALSAGLLPVLGITWVNSLFLLGVATAQVPRGRLALVASIGVGLGMVSYAAIYDAVNFGGLTAYEYGWNAAYAGALYFLSVAGLWSAVRLMPIIAALEGARAELAVHSARTERRRLSRDLHDVLGQSLTAISLKADLARRLVPNDRGAAAREVEALAGIAGSLVGELEAVARDERAIALATETVAAVELLQAAGIAVRTDVRAEGLGGDASSVLGWAVREGATNILRHSRARECDLRVVRTNGVVVLEIVNDGARLREGRGTGLASLADRVAAVEGATTVTATEGGRFRLRVEVPSQ